MSEEDAPKHATRDRFEALWMLIGMTPSWVPLAAFAGISIPCTFIYPFKGWLATTALSLLIVALIILGAGVHAARQYVARQRRRDERRKQIRRRNERSSLLRHDLKPLIMAVESALLEREPDVRRERLRQARNTIVCSTSNLVGPEGSGTRANLFKREGKKAGHRKYRLEAGMFHGRGDQSTRVFEEDHPTVLASLAGEQRFVRQTDEDDSNLEYETYLTSPVLSPETGYLYGILTVDCLQSGDLVKERDAPMMEILAALVALTYAGETL